MADEAIDYMNRLNAVAPDKPFQETRRERA
jgi:hypothetical protein